MLTVQCSSLGTSNKQTWDNAFHESPEYDLSGLAKTPIYLSRRDRGKVLKLPALGLVLTFSSNSVFKCQVPSHMTKFPHIRTANLYDIKPLQRTYNKLFVPSFFKTAFHFIAAFQVSSGFFTSLPGWGRGETKKNNNNIHQVHWVFWNMEDVTK